MLVNASLLFCCTTALKRAGCSNFKRVLGDVLKGCDTRPHSFLGRCFIMITQSTVLSVVYPTPVSFNAALKLCLERHTTAITVSRGERYFTVHDFCASVVTIDKDSWLLLAHCCTIQILCCAYTAGLYLLAEI